MWKEIFGDDVVKCFEDDLLSLVLFVVLIVVGIFVDIKLIFRSFLRSFLFFRIVRFFELSFW